MSSHNTTLINLSSSSIGTASEVTNMHLLPCKIQHNGEAKVDEYFQSSIKGTSEGKLRGSLFSVFFYKYVEKKERENAISWGPLKSQAKGLFSRFYDIQIK